MVDAMVIVAHPKPGSFSHAMASEAAEALREAGMSLAWHDLYQEGFDPVLRPEEMDFTQTRTPEAFEAGGDAIVTEHRRELVHAQVLVIAHPNWWGKPPAIMAGWIDRVLAPGIAYTFDEVGGRPVKLLPLREVLVLNTSDTPPEREASELGDPLANIWGRCVAAYLNARVQRVVAAPITGSTLAERQAWLSDARTIAASFAPA